MHGRTLFLSGKQQRAHASVLYRQMDLTTSPNGQFALKTALNIVRTPSTKFNLANIIWFPGHVPNMSCCTLRAIHERLPTTARLKQFQIVASDTCTLCDTGTETINHLFFACPYSSYIWTLCKMKLRIISTPQNLVEEAASIKMKFQSKGKCYYLTRLVLCGAIWHIWRERNRKIFQQ